MRRLAHLRPLHSLGRPMAKTLATATLLASCRTMRGVGGSNLTWDPWAVGGMGRKPEGGGRRKFGRSRPQRARIRTSIRATGTSGRGGAKFQGSGPATTGQRRTWTAAQLAWPAMQTVSFTPHPSGLPPRRRQVASVRDEAVGEQCVWQSFRIAPHMPPQTQRSMSPGRRRGPGAVATRAKCRQVCCRTSHGERTQPHVAKPC